MYSKKSLLLTGISMVLLCGLPYSGWTREAPESSREAPRLSKEKVLQMLRRPGVFFLDVRTSADWDASTSKIPGAIREDPREVSTWGSLLDKKGTYILYCA